jgi:acyl carrier protein
MTDKSKDALINIISECLGVKKEEIKSESKFVEDLAADSLDVAELIVNIEDKFNLKINEADVDKFQKVKDLADYLNNLVKE